MGEGANESLCEFHVNGYEIYVQKQRGFRHAYTEVWPQVTGDVVITFSPDGNSVPELIPELIAKLKEGYRCCAGEPPIISSLLGNCGFGDRL